MYAVCKFIAIVIAFFCPFPFLPFRSRMHCETRWPFRPIYELIKTRQIVWLCFSLSLYQFLLLLFKMKKKIRMWNCEMKRYTFNELPSDFFGKTWKFWQSEWETRWSIIFFLQKILIKKRYVICNQKIPEE